MISLEHLNPKYRYTRHSFTISLLELWSTE